MQQVTLILSVSSAVMPIIFGFIVWKLTKVFVTKEEFKDFKEHAEHERGEIKAQLKDITTSTNSMLKDVATLIERTAKRHT